MSSGARTRILSVVGAVIALVLVLAIVRLRSRTDDGLRAGGDGGTGRSVGGGPATAGDPLAIGAIEGRVLGADDAPRAGVFVAVRSAHVRRSVSTDDAGRFVVPALAPGRLTISASTPEGDAAVVACNLVANVTSHVELRLAPIAGSVMLGGHVHDILGGPVGSAEVWIGTEGEGPTVIARTGGAGEFSQRVARGKHELRVRAAGYAEAAESIEMTGDLAVEIVIHPAATIRGIVVRADGSAVSGAAVRARAHRAEDFAGTTDSDGKFELPNLPTGTFDLEARTSKEVGVMRDVNVAPASTRDVRVEVEAAAAVAGRVQSSDGAPVAGAKVQAVDTVAVGEAATTGSDGGFRIASLLPGVVAVRACASGYTCVRSADHVASAVLSTDVSITLSDAGRVHVRVVDKDDKPLPNAHAFLADFSGCDTDASGECTLESVTVRKTHLRARHLFGGYARKEIDVQLGGATQVIKLTPGATVRGTVHWDDGPPAAGVHVFSHDNVTRTNADGRYELANVEPGFVNVRAAAAIELGARRSQPFDPSDAKQIAQPQLAAGEVREHVDLVLARRSKRISGTVIGADGAPVPFARVGLMRDDPKSQIWGEQAGAGLFATVSTYSGPDGTFAIESVAAGEYIVWANAEEQPTGRTAVTSGGERVTIRLPAAGVIEGDVKSEAGSVVSGLVVRVAGARDRVVRVSSDRGRFVVAGLAAGTYRVTFECFRVAQAAPLAGPLIAEVDVEIAAGERKEIAVVAGEPLTLTGRVVSWPEMVPLPGVTISTRGPRRRNAAATGADGRFRVDGVAPGTIELSTSDVRGDQEEWKREAPRGTEIVDVGDLAAAEGKRGGLSFAFEPDGRRALVTRFAPHEVGLEEGDEILSIGGHVVATLGARSLAGVIKEIAPGVPVVVKRVGESGPKTLELRR